jgi:hypothetical protein
MTTRRLRTHLGWSVALAASGVLASCSLPKPVETSGPATGSPATIAIERTELQRSLVALAERSSRRLDAALDDLRGRSQPAVPFDEVLGFVAGYEALLAERAADVDPARGLRDVALVARTHGTIVEARSASLSDATGLDLLRRALAADELEAMDLAGRHLRAADVAAIEASDVAQSGGSNVGGRLVVVPPSADQQQPLASFIEPATDTARALERDALRSERERTTIASLPERMRRQAELLAAGVAGREDLGRLAAAIDDARGTLDRLGSSIDAARSTARDIEARVAAIDPADLAPAKELATEVRLALAEAKEALPKAEATIVELRNVVAGAERVTKSLEALTTGPDGTPIDLSALAGASERFMTAASDLRSAVDQANRLLASDESTARLRALAETGRASIDHLTFRIALLFVIAAALAVVLMVVRALTRPRAEPQQRPARRA